MKPTLLVLAAGLGSRFKGTKQLESVGLHSETLLDYSCYDAKRNGYGKIVFIIRPDIEKQFRESLFDRISQNIDAQYVFQTTQSLLSNSQKSKAQNREKPWGTIHAILCAQNAINEPFTIINADDYYGEKAYSISGSYLNNIDINSTQYAMIGYILKNTMSPLGSVSRAICTVSKDNLLKNMVENTQIEFEGDKIVSHLSSVNTYLSGDEIVSMNYFCFTPKVFDYMNLYWENFIKTNIEELKSECLLPNCAGEIVRTGNGSIRMFSSPDKWFGMTYREDRETVRKNLEQKTAEGLYPEKLWEK